MAVKEINEKSVPERYATIIHTEKLFVGQILKAYDKGFIKLAPKAKANMSTFVGIMSANPTQEILHSSDNSHAKLRLLISCGDHQSPLQSQQDSSVRVNKVMLQLEIAKALLESQAQEFGDTTGELHAYLLTLTIKNTNKGNLDDDYKKHRSRVSKMMKALKDGASNKNGVQLVGGDYVGAFVSHEITVKNEFIEKEATRGIYHPHTHVVILSDAVLDEEATAEVLLAKWRAVNPDKSLSKDGFDFKGCYVPQSDNVARDSQTSVVREAIKYTVKPETWNKLGSLDNDYSVEVFSEIYNANKGKKLKQSHGIMETAKNFLSTFGDFENAMSFSLLDQFPDIVTQLSELRFNKNLSLYGGYESHYKRELTTDEILQYNGSMLKDVLVTADLEARIEAFFDKYDDDLTGRKQRIYSATFKKFVFKQTVYEMGARLVDFQRIELAKNNELKAYDLGLLVNAVAGHVKNSYMINNWQNLEKLVFSGSSHEQAMKERIDQVEKLFHERVGALHGVNASVENHNMLADFKKKQGLNMPRTDAYGNVEIGLFIDDKFKKTDKDGEVEDYFGLRLFGDDWATVKR